jgi:hypothetical protein
MGHQHVDKLREHIDYADHDSYALLSTSPDVHRAAIFVHGYGGHPFKTWCKMQDMISADPNWDNTDAYFVGYDSTGDEVMLSAAYMARIIREICPEPPDGIFKIRSRSAVYRLRGQGTKYSSIDLIGHSLGGVVLRVAILELLKQGFAATGAEDVSQLPAAYALPCSARLRLFAPAQGGARLSGVMGMMRQVAGLRSLVNIYRGGSSSFQELEPGSSVLQMLREDTNSFADRFPQLSGLRARIVWAQRDRVVTSLPFRHDVSYTLLDTDHISVCKPNLKNPAPFAFVSNGVIEHEDGAL